MEKVIEIINTMVNIPGESKQRKVKDGNPLPWWQLLLTWRPMGVSL